MGDAAALHAERALRDTLVLQDGSGGRPYDAHVEAAIRIQTWFRRALAERAYITLLAQKIEADYHGGSRGPLLCQGHQTTHVVSQIQAMILTASRWTHPAPICRVCVVHCSATSY